VLHRGNLLPHLCFVAPEPGMALSDDI
jgi:hypothetical protein